MNIKKHHEIALIEIGIDGPGAMAEHAALVDADIALLTHIGIEHLENFSGLEQIAKEECLLFEHQLEKRRKILVNLDDKHLSPYRKQSTLNFSFFDQSADLFAEMQSARFQVSYLQKKLNFASPFLERFNLQNTLAAISVVASLGDFDDLNKETLTQKIHLDRRSLLTSSDKFGKIYFDAYNSGPNALRASLSEFVDRAKKENLQACLILGDMLELGESSEQLHAQIFDYLEKEDWLDAKIFLTGRSVSSLFRKFCSEAVVSEYYLEKKALEQSLAAYVETKWENSLVFAILKLLVL